MNTPEHEDRAEKAEDPADGHARTIAELVEADAARKREQTGRVFGFDPDNQQEDQHDE